MIKRFRVQNYKALRDVELQLTPIHVLIGPNDSGKTSILEALNSLLKSVDQPLPLAFEGPEGSRTGRELVWQGADVPVSFEVEFAPEMTYILEIRFANGVHVEREVIYGSVCPDFSGQYTCFYASMNVGFLPPQIEEIKDKFKQPYSLLSGVHLYRWIPRMLSLPCAPDPNRRLRMTLEGFGLALVLDEILGFDRQLFDSLEQQFRAIFPQVKSIKLLQSPAYRVQEDSRQDFPLFQKAAGKGLYFEMKDGGDLIPASEISDGLLLILAYVTILNLPEPPRLLLIEEPENGIHPQRLRMVLRILRDLVASQQHTQVVLTTHSPYVVDQFKPEEVTLCSKDSDGAVKVTRLSNSAAVSRQINTFTLGEIWTAEGDEALAAAGNGSK